jgi:hypothetical protein
VHRLRGGQREAEGGVQVTTFAILAPDLEKPHERLLKAMVQRTFRGDEHPYFPVESWEAAAPFTNILSVGKAALDLWHEYNLIAVGRHRGCLFTHTNHNIMVLEHPGTLMQLSMVGHQAKDNMAGDLLAWRMMLEGEVLPNRQMAECAVCRRKKDSLRREAYHWPVEVDGVGLCDDHKRRMGQLTRRPKKRLNPSSAAAQIAGQEELFA